MNMNKDFNLINEDDSKVDVINKFSKLFSLEEDLTDYSNKSADDFFEYIVKIKPEKSLEDIEYSCAMWSKFHKLYVKTFIKNEIVSANWYVEGLLFCCNEFECKEKCKYFAYILNHYYKGEMERLFEVLISKEDYETCAILVKYQNTNQIPPSVFDYF